MRNAPTPPPAPTPVPIEAKANPYASGSTGPIEGGFEGAPKDRHGRNFRFNPKGKYVQLGNQMRQEAQLEALKQRIAESAKKAGLDSEFETLEKNIRVRYYSERVLACSYSSVTFCSATHLLRRSGGTLRYCLTRPTMILSWVFRR